MKEDLTMERDLDFYELQDKKSELIKKRDELRKETPKKEEDILKEKEKK